VLEYGGTTRGETRTDIHINTEGIVMKYGNQILAHQHGIGRIAYGWRIIVILREVKLRAKKKKRARPNYNRERQLYTYTYPFCPCRWKDPR